MKLEKSVGFPSLYKKKEVGSSGEKGVCLGTSGSSRGHKLGNGPKREKMRRKKGNLIGFPNRKLRSFGSKSGERKKRKERRVERSCTVRKRKTRSKGSEGGRLLQIARRRRKNPRFYHRAKKRVVVFLVRKAARWKLSASSRKLGRTVFSMCNKPSFPKIQRRRRLANYCLPDVKPE